MSEKQDQELYEALAKFCDSSHFLDLQQSQQEFIKGCLSFLGRQGYLSPKQTSACLDILSQPVNRERIIDLISDLFNPKEKLKTF